jgi:hypothetical protein
MYIYIYIYIYMQICIHSHVHVHTDCGQVPSQAKTLYVYVHTHTFTFIHTCTHRLWASSKPSQDVLYIYVHTHTCIYVYFHTYIYTQIVGKFQAKPTRSVMLVVWIRAVLTQHTSYLMSQPDIVKTLTPLYQIVESR